MIGKVELALGSIFALLGVRSLVLWLATRFDAQSFGELALYGLHVTSRVAIWFTLAAAFFGYALLDEPQRYQWFLFVPMFLAAVQLLTGLLLARQPVGSGGGTSEEDASRAAEPRGAGKPGGLGRS